MNRGTPSTGHVGLMLVGGAAITLNRSDGAKAGGQERTLGTTGEPPNNGMQLTKAARCAPFAFRSWGQSLRAAFAADPECSAGEARGTQSAITVVSRSDALSVESLR